MAIPGRAWAGRVRADAAFLLSGLAWQLTGPLAALTVAAMPRWSQAQWRRLRRHGEQDALAPVPMRRALRTAAGWRQLAYHLIVAPLFGLATITALAGAAGTWVLITVPIWMWATRGQRVGGHSPVITAGYASLVGVLVLVVLIALLHPLARADARATQALLGPSRNAALAARLDELAGNRQALLDAVDGERRRIERDLHDGAQQRLVALSVNLGLAEVTVEDLPPEARRVIADARRQAEAALADLTGVVRGLHPPILEDRGLVPALSSLAADLPLPVTLAVADVGRLAPSVEAVAYYVIAEALTNAVKHSGAGRVEVGLTRRDGRLAVWVCDDGSGGADAARGTGLTGLARRVASVDGRLRVTSPSGGPTVLEAELPCAP